MYFIFSWHVNYSRSKSIPDQCVYRVYIGRKEDPDPPRCTLFLEPIRGEEDLEEACRPQQYRHVDPGCLAS